MNSEEVARIKAWLGAGSINIFGLPFSGKDTHAAELANLLDAEIVGGGDILRASEGLEHVKAHIAKGNLAPTEDYLKTVLPYLSQPKFSGKPLVLSSVGRWYGEEESVIQAAKASGHPIKAVLYLSISQTEARKRWELAERGREDDAAEHILLNRFEEFSQKTLPVIEYYKEQGLLIEVDGEPAVKAVSEVILSKLASIASH